MTTNKIILVDADGVLVNWNKGFRSWMSDRGFPLCTGSSYNLGTCYNLERKEIVALIEEYNRSAAVSYLQPMPGATLVMGKLRELGYEIHCISSFGGDTYSQIQRCNMLWDYFKIHACNIELLPLDGSKVQSLKRWEGSGAYWIEDKLENALDGKKLGLDSILLRAEHTSAYVSDEIYVADHWYEIYGYITGEEKCPTSGSSFTLPSRPSTAM